MKIDGEKTPWLEPGAGEISKRIFGPNATQAENAAVVHACAMTSIAITLKRVVDMIEPVAKLALAQAEKELSEMKGKR